MKYVRIFTDGGCVPNPGRGGWGAILMYQEHKREIFGGERHTTNNQMEMMAAIMALETLKAPCSVDLYSDSRYLVDGANSWIKSWKQRNWMTRGKTPVKNADLWRRLDAQLSRHNVVFSWVRGHSGNEHNERCDQLAEIGRMMIAEAA